MIPTIDPNTPEGMRKLTDVWASAFYSGALTAAYNMSLPSATTELDRAALLTASRAAARTATHRGLADRCAYEEIQEGIKAALAGQHRHNTRIKIDLEDQP